MATVFAPISTERLLIRPCRTADAEALVRRRNDPAVAALQSWTLPFSRDEANAIVKASAEEAEPTDGSWWMATIERTADGEILGDVNVRPTFEGRSAEIGYNLAREHWGRGYATEAVSALLERLWSAPALTRVQGSIDPDNLASAFVLERTGFLLEARMRCSFWNGDECSDDFVYAMLREDWEAWRARPRTAPETVRLVEIDEPLSRRVRALATHATQERFVSPVLDSFADALFPGRIDGHAVVPWPRAIEADGEVVGFVMLAASTSSRRTPYLWRLLVDRLHQSRGIGRATLDLVVAACRSRGAESLLVSWSEGRGSPRPFYERYGFVPTGEIVDEETEAVLTFDDVST